MSNSLVINADSVKTNALAKLENATRMLAECRTVQDAKKIADLAAAAVEYATRQRLGKEAILYATEIHVDGLTLVGEFLQQTPKNKGGQPMQSTGRQLRPVETEPTLESIGLTKDESQCSQALARAKKDEPKLHQCVRRAEISIRQAARLMAKKQKRQKREKDAKKALEELDAAKLESLNSVCDVRHCSCAELFASGIQPQVVFTDPPYERKSLECYTELAKACVNVPVVAVMTGHLFLPEVFARLCAHLKYRWLLAYLTPGGQSSQVWPAKVIQFWKPVILLGQASTWLGDVAKSDPNDNDKDHHHWGQSESGITDVLRRIVNPGDLVCDPFCGAGTTAVAALKLGCRFVGCDIDKSCIEKTRSRLI